MIGCFYKHRELTGGQWGSPKGGSKKRSREQGFEMGGGLVERLGMGGSEEAG